MDHELQVFQALQTVLLGLWDIQNTPKAQSLHVCLEGSARLICTQLVILAKAEAGLVKMKRKQKLILQSWKVWCNSVQEWASSQIKQCMNQGEIMTNNRLVPSAAAWAKSLFSNRTELGELNISILSQDSNTDVYTTVSYRTRHHS